MLESEIRRMGFNPQGFPNEWQILEADSHGKVCYVFYMFYDLRHGIFHSGEDFDGICFKSPREQVWCRECFLEAKQINEGKDLEGTIGLFYEIAACGSLEDAEDFKQNYGPYCFRCNAINTISSKITKAATISGMAAKIRKKKKKKMYM